ncbi:pseudouridine synthase [Lacticaseibacillus baoqingensis]|uniref:Pseudouridine synthase n=1 Tax=Lacticaseibacillus baoqingensis TaxID=2486013 RepID=A0ABW4E4F1_9LACO|nr:16S rRNA pseudouridine(516) synthase [Lacticaseibacillus baoqingensis]
MRLDKYLSHMQLGSRSVVRALIAKRQVLVDGQVVRDAGLAVDATNQISVNGQVISGQLAVTYLLNKPAGVITATNDAHAKTVLDLIAPADRRPGLFPVGRLDKDTTGLLLLTTDGALGHQLLAPKRHVPKTYVATLQAPVTPAMVAELEAGIAFKDFVSAPASVRVLAAQKAEITIHEGKFHQVKRMFHAVGTEVVTLQRIQMGALRLPADLPLGAYRPLAPTEAAALAE